MLSIHRLNGLVALLWDKDRKVISKFKMKLRKNGKTYESVQSGAPAEVYRQGGLYKEIFDASARSMNADKIAATME